MINKISPSNLHFQAHPNHNGKTQNSDLAFTILNDTTGVAHHDSVGFKSRDASERFGDSEKTGPKGKSTDASHQTRTRRSLNLHVDKSSHLVVELKTGY